MSGLQTPMNTTQKLSIATKFFPIIIIIAVIGFGIYFGLPLISSNTVTKPTQAEASLTNPVDVTEDSSDRERDPKDPCTTARLNTISSIEKWKEWYEIDLLPYLNDGDLKTSATVDDIKEILAQDDEVISINMCLQRKIKETKEAATTYNKVLGENKRLEDVIKRRGTDIQVAKDRALLAIDPDMTRNYYSGWFPMSRPIKDSTVPILIGFSIFFTALVFLTILAIIGLDVRILRPNVKMNVTGGKNNIIKILGGIIVILIGVTIYGFTKAK